MPPGYLPPSVRVGNGALFHQKCLCCTAVGRCQQIVTVGAADTKDSGEPLIYLSAALIIALPQ